MTYAYREPRRTTLGVKYIQYVMRCYGTAVVYTYRPLFASLRTYHAHAVVQVEPELFFLGRRLPPRLPRQPRPRDEVREVLEGARPGPVDPSPPIAARDPRVVARRRRRPSMSIDPAAGRASPRRRQRDDAGGDRRTRRRRRRSVRDGREKLAHLPLPVPSLRREPSARVPVLSPQPGALRRRARSAAARAPPAPARARARARAPARARVAAVDVEDVRVPGRGVPGGAARFDRRRRRRTMMTRLFPRRRRRRRRRRRLGRSRRRRRLRSRRRGVRRRRRLGRGRGLRRGLRRGRGRRRGRFGRRLRVCFVRARRVARGNRVRALLLLLQCLLLLLRGRGRRGLRFRRVLLALDRCGRRRRRRRVPVVRRGSWSLPLRRGGIRRRGFRSLALALALGRRLDRLGDDRLGRDRLGDDRLGDDRLGDGLAHDARVARAAFSTSDEPEAPNNVAACGHNNWDAVRGRQSSIISNIAHEHLVSKILQKSILPSP
eukprot:29021-Pelagococcus_subviridis.AAC.3